MPHDHNAAQVQACHTTIMLVLSQELDSANATVDRLQYEMEAG